MKSLSINDITTLIQFPVAQAPCVSIYTPTHRHFPGTEQDPIRFKNLLKDAKQSLIEAGLDVAKVGEMLRPAQAILDDSQFWKHSSDGLGVFIAQDFFRYYRVPVRVPELLVVTQRFHLKPLIAVLSRDRRFFVLTLSQKQARLFEGSFESASEITPDDFPEGLAAVLEQYDPAQQLQSHSATGGSPTLRGSIFHGQGGGADDLKPRILEYFRQIDKSLVNGLAQERSPLVLAGVDYLLPMYRDVSTYSNLAEGALIGNPDSSGVEELHRRAWTVVEPLFQKTRKEAAERYHALTRTGRASHELDKIVPAAFHGRVESLWVAVGVQRWGKFDANSGAVDKHDQPGPNDEDLLDLTAVRTLLNGGEVFAVDPADVPGNRAAAAIFRY